MSLPCPLCGNDLKRETHNREGCPVELIRGTAKTGLLTWSVLGAAAAFSMSAAIAKVSEQEIPNSIFGVAMAIGAATGFLAHHRAFAGALRVKRES